MKNLPAVNDLPDHLGYWLRHVSNHVSHAFARRVEGRGVTVAEWVILRKGYDSPATSVSLLADLTGLTRGAVSKLVDRLVAKRLLQKKGERGDKRRQEIKLTASGRALIPQLARLADENDRAFFSVLTRAERAQILAVMKKLAGAHRLHGVAID